MKETAQSTKQKPAVALVAHDAKKSEMINWVNAQVQRLKDFQLFATGTTGKLINAQTALDVQRLQSGPLGGDQQIGAMISEGKIDILIFFWDPLSQQPHDPDVKALLRLAAVWNIPTACNKSTADYIFHSTCLSEDYRSERPDFSQHINRNV